MGTLTKAAYSKLIEENILEIKKHMPDSLERMHTIEVLEDSVRQFKPLPSKAVELSDDLSISSLLAKYQHQKPKDFGDFKEREYPVSAVIEIIRELQSFPKDKEQVIKEPDAYILPWGEWISTSEYHKRINRKVDVSKYKAVWFSPTKESNTEEEKK